jgi:hypothetical protein
MREDKCINGHSLLDPDNVTIGKTRGGRICKTCQRWRGRYYSAVKRDSKLSHMEVEFLKKEEAIG